MFFLEFSREALITEKNCFFMTSFNMQNKLHYQVLWFSFTEISLRTSWPLCKSPCDSFVLQNLGSAETPKSAFENAISVTFSFSFFYFSVRPQPTPFLCLHTFEMRFHWLSSTVMFWTLGLPGTIFFHSDFGSHFFILGLLSAYI